MLSCVYIVSTVIFAELIFMPYIYSLLFRLLSGSHGLVRTGAHAMLAPIQKIRACFAWRELASTLFLPCLVCFVFSFTLMPWGEMELVSYAHAESIESRYEKAKDELAKLEADSKRADLRAPWERLDKIFTALHNDAKNWSNVAAIAYRVAIVRDELARHSFSKADYLRAAQTYEDVARLYPRSVLADDALLSAALLRTNRLSDSVGSTAILRRLISDYPKGDMAPTAKALLAGADTDIFPPHRWDNGKSPLGSGGASSKTPAKANPAPKASEPVKPTPKVEKTPPPAPLPPLPSSKLRHLSWHNGPTLGTVLLDLDREARWRHQFIPAGTMGNALPLLYVDVDNCRIGSDKVSRGGRVSGTILSSVAVDTSAKEYIRFIIEFTAIQSYDVQVEHRNGYALRITASANKGGEGASGSVAAPSHNAVPSSGKSETTASKTSPSKTPPANTPSNKKPEPATPPAPPKSVIEQLGLGIHTIMIDAGHGGKDPGAIGHGLRESEIVLDMALRVAKGLRAKGFKVLFTRDDDTFIALTDRTQLANKHKADLFISLHVNASTKKTTNGIETYYYASTSYSNSAAKVAARENAVKEKQLTETQLIISDLTLGFKTHESESLATKIQNSMLKSLKGAGYKIQNNGVRSAPFYVLMGARMPAVLLEIGYCTHAEEAARLATSKYRARITEGIVQGIVDYKNSLKAL